MGETPLGTDPAVRMLKWLVVALTATMTVGVVVMVAVFVVRFPSPVPAFPEALALPAGQAAEAVTRGPGYLLVVTRGGEILVMSPDGGEVRQRIEVVP